MADTIHVKGLAELQTFLDELPAKMERNVMRGALRAGMQQIEPIAKGLARKRSGLLADGLKVGSRTLGTVVIGYLHATGKHSFVAPWLEYGTKAHDIAAKTDGLLAFGGIFRKAVWHPGAMPYPFMRPALDSGAQAAVIAAAEYMKNRLATKFGLDTVDVVIEGDV